MALNGKFISYKHIVEGVHRDYGFTDFSLSDAIEWISEGLLLIGEVPQYVHKITDGNQSLYHPSPIDITNGRGELPCDLYEIIMVRDYDTKTPLLRSFDKFHHAYSCDSEPKCGTNCAKELTYKVNNNYIFSGKSDGKLEMSYLGIATDKEGYPLIPDNQSYIKALKYYLAERIATKLFLRDQISRDKLQLIERDRDWYTGQAKEAAATPDIDTMESIKNQMVRLIPKINRHAASFKYSNDPEKRFISTK